jgi:RNA polymerase sigma-70 factor (ECF subfamily)
VLHEDKALLAAYRAGETWAFEILYRAFEAPVRRFVTSGFTFVSRGRTCRFRGLSGGVDLDSVLQETFARAFAASTRKLYDGERPFKNYLFSIAKNLVLRELSRKERVLPVDITEEQTDAIARRSADQPASLYRGIADPEHSLADGELTDVTRDFIADLDDEERAFFQSRFVEGRTQEAAATDMGVTRARVKLLEKELRKRFLTTLRGHGYFVGYEPKPRWTRHGKEHEAVAAA